MAAAEAQLELPSVCPRSSDASLHCDIYNCHEYSNAACSCREITHGRSSPQAPVLKLWSGFCSAGEEWQLVGMGARGSGSR